MKREEAVQALDQIKAEVEAELVDMMLNPETHPEPLELYYERHEQLAKKMAKIVAEVEK
jgi:hypothetical protein